LWLIPDWTREHALVKCNWESTIVYSSSSLCLSVDSGVL
jgi:hypothetical protein